MKISGRVLHFDITKWRVPRIAWPREMFSLLAFLLLVFVASIITPRFLTFFNIRNVLTQVSIIATLALGETFVILIGGIDLSVGSVLAVSGAVTAALMKILNLPILIAILGGLTTGAICGMFSGLLVTRFKIPSFIATLATMSIARGGTLLITGGVPISGFPQSFRAIAGHLGPLNILTILMFFLYGAGLLLLFFTVFGRRIYAIGGNEEAARYSGLQVNPTKLLVFILSGVCAGLGGVMLNARLGAAYPMAGEGYELEAIAACVLGGVSFAGGVGSPGGTLLGALIMAVLSNVMNMLRISPFYQYVVRGLILALAAISLARGAKFAK